MTKKKIYTEADIISLNKRGIKEIHLSKNDLVTPLARDRAKLFSIDLLDAEKLIIKTQETNKEFDKKRTCAIGSDHTGYKMKNIVIEFLRSKNISTIDLGTKDEQSCDYPDFAYAVAKKVKDREVCFGVLLDATGIPSAITANKLIGIRAATCYNEFSAKSAREHNNANIIVMGAKTLGEETIKSILDAWLNTNFGGERHQRRLDKISAIEKLNLK